MPTKKYDELPVDKWNTRHFQTYIADEHMRRYNVSYLPGRGWQAEAGLLGSIIGTARKQGTHDKALIKRFIDDCYAEHKVSAQYPGVSFLWFWTYKKAVLQRIEAEVNRKTAVSETDDTDWKGADEWL